MTKSISTVSSSRSPTNSVKNPKISHPTQNRASLPPGALASFLLRRPAGCRPPLSLLHRPASLLCPPACSTSSRAPPGLQQGASRRAPPGPQQGPPGAQQSSASLLCSLLLPAVAAWSEDPKKPRHVPQASRQQRPLLPPCFEGEHKRLWKN